MDKKKVKELMEQILLYCDQAYKPNWQPKSFEEFIKLGNICREVIKEIDKSDWVSVEDRQPPKNVVVQVCNKQEPDDLVLAYRTNKNTMKIVYPNIIHTITHWKPIGKLEE